jgi:hypothetical protein
MATEYKLSYTATEIDEKLSMVDEMVKTVNGTAPDESGNVTLDFSSAVNEALTDAKESGEFDGEDGYTPIKGTDYWTEEDKQEIKTYIDNTIASIEEALAEI